MLLKINSKRQVTLPAEVLDALGVKPGDRLELRETADGYALRPRRVDMSRLGLLHDKIPPNHPPFDLERFRNDRKMAALPGVREL